MPDPAATDFDDGLAHWVAQAQARRPPEPPRAKLPSSKHGHLSANFLYKSQGSTEDALCTEDRRAEAGERIDKVKKSKEEDALDLENLGLTGLPAQIGDLARLKDLNLNFNRLKSLPAQFDQLVNLKVLKAGGVNQFSSFPRVILRLENLVHLDLSGNRLRTIPKGLGELVRLTRLHLDSNYIEKLPHQIYRLSSLQVFSASSNPYLSTVPTDMGKLKLRRVDLSNTQIATLPGWNRMIEENMVSLNLASTNFGGFDESLKVPKRLKLADLSFTKVQTLPASFGPMTFYGNANGNILRTTHKLLWFENLRIKADGINLPAELEREARMMTRQPIKRLTPLRHELRHPPPENQDNDVDSGSDDGGDIDFHMRWMDNTGPVDLAHAQRVREAAVNRLPTGRVADFAAALAAEEFADRWGENPPQPATLNPWGNDPVPPWPGLGSATGWAQPVMQPVMQPSMQLGMQLGMQPGPQPSRWADRIRQTGSPALVAPAAAVQPGVWMGQPTPPSVAGYFPAAAPGVWLQPQAVTSIEQLNAFTQLLALGAMPVQAAPVQNGPQPFTPGPGTTQPPGVAPPQAQGERPPGIYLSPSVPLGSRVRPPMWAPQPTWTDSAANLAENVGSFLRRRGQ